MSAKVRDLVDWIGEIAPWELAEEWDNVGLLVGRPDREVDRALIALDLTSDLLDEADRIGAQLIITHHPVLFAARRTLREDDPEGALLCRMVRRGISLIAAHTNFDNADPGLNGALADVLGLGAHEPIEHGLRVGLFDGTLFELKRRAQAELGDVIRVYGDETRSLRRVCVCGGAGGMYWKEARASGSDAYLTGEMRYHDALEALSLGMCVLEAGHRATEAIAMKAILSHLQNRSDAVQYYQR